MSNLWSEISNFDSYVTFTKNPILHLVETKYYKWPYGYINNLYILWEKKIFCNKNRFETRGIFENEPLPWQQNLDILTKSLNWPSVRCGFDHFTSWYVSNTCIDERDNLFTKYQEYNICWLSMSKLLPWRQYWERLLKHWFLLYLYFNLADFQEIV